MSYGEINGPIIGIIMKEGMRRSNKAIRDLRHTYETMEKPSEDPRGDFVTSADIAGQKAYMKVLRDCFPDYGIIAEESDLPGACLSIPCTRTDMNLCWTIDPLDGTKAWTRRQSHGIGSMVSLVNFDTKEILAAAVGDVMTSEMYYYRPDSTKVHRVSEFDVATELVVTPKPLIGQYILLRDDPRICSKHTQIVSEPGRIFRNCEVSGGSIGIHFARLWKGEVGALILPPQKKETPWDMAPILGVTQKLGFELYGFDSRTGRICELHIPVQPAPWRREGDLIVIHKSAANDFKDRVAMLMC